MIILGHRGYSARYPENTLLAFKKAIEFGADGVELDVYLTKDGKVVVHHDESLKRTVGIDKKIKECRYEEIKNLKFENQTIPLLEDVYRNLPPNAIINVEIKDRDAVSKVIDIVKKYGKFRNTIFSSFDIGALKKLREMSDEARIGILLDSCRSGLLFPYYGRKIKAEFVNPPILARKRLGFLFIFFIRLYKFLGYKIALWTVNDPKDIEGMEDVCDAIITDDVETIVKYFRRYSSDF